ncbi:MAG: hypothetical protein KF819_07695 [Labilithrix sp.]|nr:hypothetical protein [Labilithrix sp.]
MRFRSSFKWVFAIGFLAYVATPAGAQPAGAPSAPAGGASGAATGDANGQVGFQRKTQLTPQEQLSESARHLARMEQAAGGVRKMLEEARKQRDVVKTLCLNDKLSQVDVAIRSGRDRRQQLQSAVNRNDVELGNHEFTILTVLRQRVEQLVAEANQCIGEEAAFVGDTRVKTTIDPTIPPDETPYPPTDPTIVIPPQCTSCTL